MRSAQAEVMDDASTAPDEYARALGDLARLNRLTLTHRPVLRWLEDAWRLVPAARPARILDVACGHGDLLRAIARRAAKAGRAVALEGIDLNPASTALARAATPATLPIVFHTGDVFAFAPDRRPDFIVCSQFTHHLTDAALVRFIRWLSAQAGLGWCIIDLHRHGFAYYGFPLLARAALLHRIVRQDGQISIARGFTAQDWRAALAEAGTQAEIAWVFPFRHRVSHLA